MAIILTRAIFLCVKYFTTLSNLWHNISAVKQSQNQQDTAQYSDWLNQGDEQATLTFRWDRWQIFNAAGDQIWGISTLFTIFIIG